MKTPNLQLPEVPEAIQTASDELNAGFRALDVVVQLAVIDKDLATPPPSPQQGDRYIVPAGAIGAWTGRERHVAYYMPDGWQFAIPRPGWRARVLDEDQWYLFAGTSWETDSSGGGGSITVVDLDDTPDEEITPVKEIRFSDTQVTDDGSGAITVKVSPLTAKGDLYTRGAALVDRQPIGTEGQYLRARAGEATGLKWETAPPVGEGASGARGYKDATQSIADATLVALTFALESFDTDAYHSIGSNTSRFIAPTDGKYMAGCSIAWDSNTSGIREIYVCLNGSTALRIAGSLQPASAGLVQSCAVPLTLTAGDYVEFYVRQNSGGARDVGAATEQVSTGWLTRIGVTAAPTLMRGATWVRAGAAIGVPTTDVQIRCPVKGTIVGVVIGTQGGPGSCVIDVWKDTHANYPPTVADTIAASAKPTISAGTKYEDTTLTGWNVAVAAGDWLFFHLESSSGFSAIFFELYIKETQ